MDRIKWLGLLALAGGICVLGYQGIESIMSEGSRFVNYTLIGMFSEESFEWIDRLPLAGIRDGADYVIHMPFYALLLIIGTLFLVISGIFGKK